ncbi:MAG: VanW family protein, partial [Clostridiales bacterium]|nr:VanW family protein [Clostridiales bacterium]
MKKQRFGFIRVLSIVAMLITVVTTSIYAENFALTGPDIYLDGTRLSDYTFPVAYMRYNTNLHNFARNFEVKVILNDKPYFLHADDISFEIDTLDLFRDLWYTGDQHPPGSTYKSTYSYDTALLDKFVDGILAELNANVTDPSTIKATFDPNTLNFTADSKKYLVGYDINRDTFRSQVDAKVQVAIWESADNKATLNITTNPIYSNPNDLAGYGLLGTYTTYTTNVANRNTNIRLAAEYISGAMVRPGGIFSYYGSLGRVTSARGFKEAGILVNGKPDTGLGGGICQVSSTIYNAALEAGMKIVERHAHSAEVSYVPKGRDATVAWPSLDFKFQNNKS